MVPIESGKLPIGFYMLGEICRDYTLRPLKVKDSLVVRHSQDAERCESDNEMMGLALLGQRLRIEGIPKESMTLDFMLNLFDDDLAEIMKAERRLSEELAIFCGKGAQTTDTGFIASEHAVGSGRGDDRKRSIGMAASVGRDQESQLESKSAPQDSAEP